MLFDATRPIILNGIEDVVSRPDLADRALFLPLPWLSEARRRPEQRLGKISNFSVPGCWGRCSMC
jgi:hypothetical protein